MESQKELLQVLLIDDDQDDFVLTRDLLDEILGGRFHLDWTPDYTKGVDAVVRGDHDVFLVDYRLGAKTGIELLRETRNRGRSGPVILFTGQGRSRTDMEALDAGADDYLEKTGLTPALLDRSIRFALVQFRASAELERKVKERTEELARANKALREADRRKDEFLATLAHELRNPLAPLRNGLEIIRLANDTGETVRRQRERLERQVAQARALVDDLLDVSRITTGKLRLTTEPLTIQEILEAAVDMSRSQIEKSQLTLSLEVPAEPIRLVGDRVAPGAGVHEPAQQRRQVHRAGGTDLARRRGVGRPGDGHPSRYGHRHPG